MPAQHDRKEWGRAYYLKNKAKIAARHKARRSAINAQRKAFALLNPEKAAKARKQKLERAAMKYRSDPGTAARIKAGSRRYYLANKSKRNAQAVQWAKNHPERAKAICKKSKDKYPEKTKLRSVNYCRKNRAKLNLIRRRWTEAHPGYNTLHNGKWSKENPEKTSLYQARRRMLERNATVNLAGIKAFIKSVKSKRTVTCYYCDSRILSKGCHFDHIVPLSKGGPHSVENLCVSCSTCNHRKSNKSISAWDRMGQQVLSL